MTAGIVQLPTSGLAALAESILRFRRETVIRELAEQRLQAAFGETVKVNDFPTTTFETDPVALRMAQVTGQA